jgi:PAS domain-containing protein
MFLRCHNTSITAREVNNCIRGMEAIAGRPDGTRIPFIPYPTPLFDASGTLIGAVNMLMDITERREAEQRIRDSEARWPRLSSPRRVMPRTPWRPGCRDGFCDRAICRAAMRSRSHRNFSRSAQRATEQRFTSREYSPAPWTNDGERSRPFDPPRRAGRSTSPLYLGRQRGLLLGGRDQWMITLGPHVTIRRTTRTTSRGNTNAGSTSLIAVIMQRGSYETAHRLPSVRTRFWSQTPPHPHLQRLSRLLLAFLQERLQQAYRAGRGR